MNITPHLKLMVQQKGSDLFFTAGAQVKIKLEGKVQSIGKSMLTPELCARLQTAS